MVLEINEKEREILRHALEVYEEELKNERVRTDNRKWKTALRDEQEVIDNILKKAA
ncbi:MAG: hypothetical protein M0Z79_10070 [Nitrospiraceae bacterium]|nr:hypothetical protein [Nitrospiraceae bacterium]